MNKKEKFKSIKKTALELSSPKGLLLPATVDAKEYALARSSEIAALQREMEQSKHGVTRRAFQTLPRHMRRRAASYNVKRLPIRLRLRALAELKHDPPKGPTNKNVRNCRRWRRRPSNLPAEKADWLPTHLWHAKRCVMTERWGHRLPLALNEKCLRSSIRAFKAGVLMYDASYWRGFELNGNEQASLPLGNVKADGTVLKADYLNASNQPIFPVILLGSKFLFVHPAAPESFAIGSPLKLGLFHLFGGGLAAFDGLNIGNCSIFISDSKKDCFITSQWSEARALWYSLVKLKPIKVCGLKILEHLSCESGTPFFPRDYPCAEAFPAHWQQRIQDLTDTWQKLPPAKRSQSPPLLPATFSSFTRPCSVRIVGRGVLQERAEIYRESQLIGFVTAALSSSLLHGCSLGIGIVTADDGGSSELECTIKNPNGVHRKVLIKPL